MMATILLPSMKARFSSMFTFATVVSSSQGEAEREIAFYEQGVCAFRLAALL